MPAPPGDLQVAILAARFDALDARFDRVEPKIDQLLAFHTAHAERLAAAEATIEQHDKALANHRNAAVGAVLTGVGGLLLGLSKLALAAFGIHL